jgi:anthranilate synthase component 1
MNVVEQTTGRTRIIPVIDTMPADLLTPLSVYLKLSANRSKSFLLESVEGGESLARYSFIGTEPWLLVTQDGNRISISDDSNERIEEISTFEFLRDHFDRFELEANEELPPFVGGAIGFFGFDCIGEFETSLQSESGKNVPQAAFMFFRSVIAFDHAKQQIKLISLAFVADENESASAMDDARARNLSIRSTLENRPVELPTKHHEFVRGEVSSNWSQSDFEAAVIEIKERILAGDCYQVVLSQRFSRPTAAHQVSIYRAMRSLNPSPYMFLIDLPDRCIIGASPEMLVKCSGAELQYRPIAGTRPRGKTAAEDSRFAIEMREDTKEVAEHMMLVDLGRNDLGRVAEFGSVRVNDLMNVEKYSHVQHLVSNLSATLRNDLDRFDALAACFPAGTVSGAPKVKAVEIIRSLEPTPRGVYAGAVGYFDYAGNMDTCIAIRTMVLKDGVAHVQAGAGIVADSVPEREFEETVHKARALLKAIDLAEAERL